MDKRALVDWYNHEWRRRTAAVAHDDAALDWIDPDYRVSWSEFTAKAEELGWTGNPVDLRLWWHSLPVRRDQTRICE